MAEANKINQDCIIHKKICDYFCTSSKCINKILCQKCIADHLQVHPRQFIYHMENLSDIHAFDKVNKMKQILGKYKVMNEQRIQKMYSPLQSLLQPLIKRHKQFIKQSRVLMEKQLVDYLAKNKKIIQQTKISKSNTNQIKNKPQLMVEQTILQVEIINQRQSQLKGNTQNYTFYADATEQLCQSLLGQLNSMVKVAIKLFDNYFKIQKSRYTQKDILKDNHHEESFFRRYTNSHEIAGKADRNNIQMTLIQSKKEMLRKEQQIKRTKHEIKEKVTKIQQLNLKIQGLREQLLQWQQKLQREQRQRLQAAGRQRKKLQEYLIKNDVISNDVHVINLQKKVLQDKYVNIVLQVVQNPIELILSQHHLTKTQLPLFCKCTSIQIFRMSFITFDKQFLSQALKNYENLHTLQLNSANIDDDALSNIAQSFSPRLKHVSLIDNKLTDQGIEYMFKNYEHKNSNRLQSLLISYNNLTPRCIQIISRYCYQIKVLHISKNPIKTSGAKNIGKFLKDVQELFIGGTGVQKEGFLAICRNCVKLKRLSLVANEVTTDIVSQILLGLQKLQWLDISYTNLSQADLQKVQKLKIFNKNVQIIAHV